MLNRVSSWKQFLAGQPYPVTLPWPESVSEVSAECEFPAHLIKYQRNGRTKFINERHLQLAKLIHTEVSDDWLPSTGKTKQPTNDFVMSRCSSNPTLTLIQWRKPRWRLCVLGSQQGSSTSSCARMALLRQFRQGENVTGSSDETAVLQKL